MYLNLTLLTELLLTITTFVILDLVVHSAYVTVEMPLLTECLKAQTACSL